MGNGMIDEAWRSRLAASVEESGKSMRKISLDAGLGPGYLHSILSEGKEPTIQNLISVCENVGVSLSYVVWGFDVTAENEEILRLLKDASPDVREGILKILQDRQTVSLDR